MTQWLRYYILLTLSAITLLVWTYMPHMQIRIGFKDTEGIRNHASNVIEKMQQNELGSYEEIDLDSTEMKDSSPKSQQNVTEDKEMERMLLFSSTSPFVFMFGTTAVKVVGSVPTECPLLFVGIHSGPNMADRRHAMRQTYLQGVDRYIVYRFILGNPTKDLVDENAKFNDMVFINQTERYTPLDSILPYKAATIMVISSRMTVKPRCLLKTDDDSLVNLYAVLKKLPEFRMDHYYGKCYSNALPIRDTNSKWFVNRDFWPDNKPYPPFCVGAGYFMSRMAYECAAILIESPWHQYFPREDVSGGMMMAECNITATDLAGVYPGGPPKLYRPFLVQHYVKTSEEIHRLWNDVLANEPARLI